ncbi:MAG: glycoside hydrolase family 15 protein [Dehalococcoidia bacterium]|nr:glycoside hydrolase family 15 protein [Dehalococcoidia bacterium]
MHTAALVGRDGSVDWLCLPRFDGGACFAALLGTPDNGCWRIGVPGARVRRRYRPGTLILETTFETDEGRATLVDFMPPRANDERSDLVRLVQGEAGHVTFEVDLALRFVYGQVVPWVRRRDFGLTAVAGPDALEIRTPLAMTGRDFRHRATFTVGAGERMPFVLSWHPSHRSPPRPLDPWRSLESTERWWQRWSGRCAYDGPDREAVSSSLTVLKALTYSPTGGIVAAPTTSLPECLGGVRNWDYRFCWLRDATFTLYALLISGYTEEACAWREWLLRAVAGEPSQLQMIYGLAGERLLPEIELPWLLGYEGSTPVRIGNAAHTQYQLDVYGEVMDCFHVAVRSGIDPSNDAWAVQRAVLDFLESGWRRPDEGLWEVRGRRREFTHSKVMAWVAFDRAVKAVERFGCEGDAERWRRVRAEIHADVCASAYDADRQTFVQSYGSQDLDAALLMIPMVGFLPPSDRRVAGTVAAIQQHLVRDGFVQRYSPREDLDGLPPGEGAFLACTFWLADNLVMLGQTEEARRIFDRLLGIRNDVGLLSEEYDPAAGRLLGNYPQAFSHVALVNTAHNLAAGSTGPAQRRAESSGARR